MKKELLFAAIMAATLGVDEQEVKQAYLAYSHDASVEYNKVEEEV